jgi:hypothetical protein
VNDGEEAASAEAVEASPVKKAKLERGPTNPTRLARLARTRKTEGLATTKLTVQGVDTPAKTTPMATRSNRRNTRRSAARGLAM